MSVVITANAFRSGEVVYWGGASDNADGGWVDDLSLARVFTAEADAEAIIKQAAPDKVVGVYAIDVEMTHKAHTPTPTPTPSHIREIIRASGPTNYAHGKDKEGRKGHVSL